MTRGPTPVPPTRRRPGLAARLLAAQLLVLGAAVVTAWLLATAVGPTVFHAHLGPISHTATPEQASRHAEEAFRTASLISLGVALAVALVVAVAVSAYVTRRIARPVQTLAAAASQVAAGRYDVSVPAPALGTEFDTLAVSFTAMAGRLDAVEATRRRLLSDLAHEMRTPVATLDAYLEGLEDGVLTLDEETSAMLRGQTRRLARLAEVISAVSRAEEHQLDLRPAAVPPQQLVDAAIAAATDRYAEAGVELAADVPAGLPPVRVDADRLAQVLGNLLDNALRHTPRGGRVGVTARAAGRTVTLAVSDTGSGIPAEHLPHVFERFYRVDAARDRAHGGSGIGLAIARAIVEAHGGEIGATSTGPGAGATFTISLPAAAPVGRIP